MICAYVILHREPTVSFDVWVHLAQAYGVEVLIVSNRTGNPQAISAHTPRGKPRIEEAIDIAEAYNKRKDFQWVIVEPFSDDGGSDPINLGEYTHLDDRVVYAFGSDRNSPPDHRDFFAGNTKYDHVYITTKDNKQFFSIHAASAALFARSLQWPKK